MGHVSMKTNQHVKYESYVKNSSQDNEQKPCEHFFTNNLVTLTYNLVNPKIKRGHGLTKTNQQVENNSGVINISQNNERKPLFYKLLCGPL